MLYLKDLKPGIMIKSSGGKNLIFVISVDIKEKSFRYRFPEDIHNVKGQIMNCRTHDGFIDESWQVDKPMVPKKVKLGELV